MRAVEIASIDPGMRNFGIARLVLHIPTLTFLVRKLTLIETEKRVNKVVRQNSDDLRRGQEITRGFHEAIKGCTVCFAEIPTGAQSARAMYSFGLAVGVLAGCPIPLIQVQPFETKLATVGTKTASKEEMIEWGVAAYPSAPWVRTKKGRLLAKNEHLADALAIGWAGLKTDEFQRLLAMWRATATASGSTAA